MKSERWRKTSIHSKNHFFLYSTNKGIKGKDQIKFSQDNICNKISFIKIRCKMYMESFTFA